MQLRRLYCSFFDIWISKLLTFFSKLPHTASWIPKSQFNLSFLDKSWFTVSVNSFTWVQRLFISSPSTTIPLGLALLYRYWPWTLQNTLAHFWLMLLQFFYLYVYFCYWKLYFLIIEISNVRNKVDLSWMKFLFSLF